MTKQRNRPIDEQEADLLGAVASLVHERRIIVQRDVTALVRRHGSTSGLAQGITATQLVPYLTEKGLLSDVSLESESDYAPIRRLCAPDASPFELALSLRKNSYLCHATAVFLHGLTDQVPQTIYVNSEQSEKPRPAGGLSQAGIDRAFRAHQRSSRYVFIHDRHRFVILSGKQAKRYGVITIAGPAGEELRTTDVERTLLDITVRPAYGGGVHEVLASFTAALEQVSVPKVLATLRALDYVYPYHQALGFYLERAGAPAASLQPFRALGLDFDFYLAHGLKKPAYDASWRIYHPQGL